jgi:isoquinoline 1-oxidoreductase beta subunit
VGSVRIEHSPIDRVYGNITFPGRRAPHPDADNALVRGVKWMATKTARELGIMATGSSSSLRDAWMPMREAGASARASLVAAAAARFGVPVTECRVEQGVVVCGTNRLRFGELASEAAAHRVTRVTLKPHAEFTMLGTSMPRSIRRRSRGADPLRHRRDDGRHALRRRHHEPDLRRPPESLRSRGGVADGRRAARSSR